MGTPDLPTVSPPSTPGSPFHFVLPEFEGPLDLLLHLIRINEIDLKDIPVVQIARQYDAMLARMRKLDLDIAGEFLVMAATLVYIKSKLLLPSDRERIDQGLEEDPRTGLVQALIEHQRYREAAEDLEKRARQAGLVFTRRPGEEIEEEGYLEVSLFDLVDALKRVLDTSQRRLQLFRRREEISLAERLHQILHQLEEKETLDFETLLTDSPGLRALIVTFLAVLELVRRGSIRALQGRPFGPIQLRRRTT
ncbi:MAG: segregation and condensation protein A [Acidobacteriota bacterium]